ncbi:hypothetical protein GCM10010430_23130 [Kitasatospora cystarginea]|uniref:Uncharacterized protein n=1 Tax=Kitasatospora cystarginea TaxID=58350 RepID=A0ABN3DT42_9ACTN
MRANHAIPVQPQAVSVRSDGPGRNPRRAGGRLPRPHVLAAGGVALAQVWGLGLGATGAYAATAEPDSALVGRADVPALLDGLTGTTAPALRHPAAPVEQVLQDRIRAGGLPLPGQAAGVPDAFAIAAVLLPAAPPQPRGDALRPSRSRPEEGADRSPSNAGAAARPGADVATDPAAVPPPLPPGGAATGGGAAVPGAATTGRRTGMVPVRFQDPAQPVADDPLSLTAATPVEPDDDLTAVLVPIAGGMLLSGAAMYKHRGLPRGH